LPELFSNKAFNSIKKLKKTRFISEAKDNKRLTENNHALKTEKVAKHLVVNLKTSLNESDISAKKV
jgi:hypothetical protein